MAHPQQHSQAQGHQHRLQSTSPRKNKPQENVSALSKSQPRQHSSAAAAVPAKISPASGGAAQSTSVPKSAAAPQQNIQTSSAVPGATAAISSSSPTPSQTKSKSSSQAHKRTQSSASQVSRTEKSESSDSISTTKTPVSSDVTKDSGNKTTPATRAHTASDTSKDDPKQSSPTLPTVTAASQKRSSLERHSNVSEKSDSQPSSSHQSQQPLNNLHDTSAGNDNASTPASTQATSLKTASAVAAEHAHESGQPAKNLEPLQQEQQDENPQAYSQDDYESDTEKDGNALVLGQEIPYNPYHEMVNEDGYLLSSLGPGAALLNPPAPEFKGKKCLVLDLDETLVHSSFKSLRNADFVIPVEIDSQYHNVYVIKRPGVDEFMKRVGELYEVVVFTASVSRYGDPLLDQLDIHKVVHHRLFRESCYNHEGNYVKNLSVLGRPLRDTIIIDNSPMSYIFHPQHAVPVSSWFSDTHDNELVDMIPFLEDLAQDKIRDVTLSLDMNVDEEADKEEEPFDLAPPFLPDPVANPIMGHVDS